MSTGTAASHRPPFPAVPGHALTMIRPSIRMSVFSYSQICTRVFCDAEAGTGRTNKFWRRQGARRCRGCSYGSRRTFCRNLKIRFCARDARERGTAQLPGLSVRWGTSCRRIVRGGRFRVLAAHDRLRHDLLDLGRHGSQRRSLPNLCVAAAQQVRLGAG